MVIGSTACSTQEQVKPVAKASSSPAPSTPATTQPARGKWAVSVPVDAGGMLAKDGTQFEIVTLDGNPQHLATGALSCSEPLAAYGGIMHCSADTKAFDIPAGTKAVAMVIGKIPAAVIQIPAGKDGGGLIHKTVRVP